jgi:hypothetical protein
VVLLEQNETVVVDHVAIVAKSTVGELHDCLMSLPAAIDH